MTKDAGVLGAVAKMKTGEQCGACLYGRTEIGGAVIFRVR